VLDNIRGIIEFTVYTDTPEDFLNKLRESSVSARKVRAGDGELSGEIYSFDERSLVRMAEKHKATYLETGRRGVIFKAAKYRKRYGIMVGIAAAFVMVFFLSNVTMKINIAGNETMSDAEVRALLSDQGIFIGSYLPNINLRSAERAIVAEVEGVAWVGIKRSGPIVSVELAQMSAKPEMIPTNMPCNVVSKRDAQIVKINSVPMGMLVPMLYDSVGEGELLVSGVIEGKLQNTYYVHALGDITGRYGERLTFNQKLVGEEISYKSRYTRRSLYLFGKRLPLYWGDDNIENAETDEETNYFNLFSLELPVGIINTEIRPYTLTEKVYTETDAVEKLNQKIARYEANFFTDEGVTVIDRQIEFTTDGETVSATVNYVLESNICETEYILVKNHK
jgi:similar to stage IV sporulation protein